MYRLRNKSEKKPLWQKSLTNLPLRPAPRFEQWLQIPLNIAKSMRKVCNEFSVQVLPHQFNYPLQDELPLLGLDETALEANICYLRQVILSGDGLPFGVNRVVVPRDVYLKHQDSLDNLGEKLIGETLLYDHPLTTRSKFEYAKVKREHPLFNIIVDSLPKTLQCRYFWARRSALRINGEDPILLTEVLLNPLPQLQFPI